MSRRGNPRSSRRKRKGDETQNPLATTVPVPAPLDPIKQGWSRLAWQCVWEVVYVQISKKEGGGACPPRLTAPSPKQAAKAGWGGHIASPVMHGGGRVGGRRWVRWDQSLPAPTQVAPLQDFEAGETDGLTPIAGGGSPSGADPPQAGEGTHQGLIPTAGEDTHQGWLFLEVKPRACRVRSRDLETQSLNPPPGWRCPERFISLTSAIQPPGHLYSSLCSRM